MVYIVLLISSKWLVEESGCFNQQSSHWLSRSCLKWPIMRWAGCQSDFDTPLTKSFNCNCFSCLFRLFTSMICRCRDVRWRKLWPCSRLIRPKRRTPLSWPLRWHRPRFRSDLTICRQRDTELFSGWCLLENCNIVIFLFNCWDVVVQ